MSDMQHALYKPVTGRLIDVAFWHLRKFCAVHYSMLSLTVHILRTIAKLHHIQDTWERPVSCLI